MPILRCTFVRFTTKSVIVKQKQKNWQHEQFWQHLHKKISLVTSPLIKLNLIYRSWGWLPKEHATESISLISSAY